MQPTPPPSLRALPQELQDLIYHHLWTHSPILWLKHFTPRAAIAITYHHAPGTPSYNERGLPRWLLTNNNILASGLTQLKRHASWSWFAAAYDVPGRANTLGGACAARNCTISDLKYLQREGETRSHCVQRVEHPGAGLASLFTRNLQLLTLGLGAHLSVHDTYRLDIARFGNAGLHLKSLRVTLLLFLKGEAEAQEREDAFVRFFEHAEREVQEVGRAWLRGEKREWGLYVNAMLPRGVVGERYDGVEMRAGTGRRRHYRMVFRVAGVEE